MKNLLKHLTAIWIILAFYGTFSNSVSAEAVDGEGNRFCQSEKMQDRLICFGYVVGFVKSAELFTTVLVKNGDDVVRESRNGLPFCLVESPNIQKVFYLFKVKIEKSPESMIHEMAIAGSIVESLSELYPCN